ncbi:hypothetical protein ANCDUO_03152 [Ancylostoma duodenale]|uniref:Uncharacterized protein n=1 Tax=Ancylostoma duodenale TaxID=51022 RepID=A0A0C2D9V2_9BILA|nr:hypothetical protein ANCDUO_03152 [Ancylostoma duodenale]
MVAIELSEQMIIFDRCLESWLDSTQKSHQKSQKEGSFTYAVHFLIGSFCSDGDIHVAHAAFCPLPATAADGYSYWNKTVKAGDALSRTLDDEWIADNAEKVTRILPGGIHVVGLLWFSERKLFNDQKSMLTRALGRIQRTNNLLTTLSLSSVSDQMALVFNEFPNGKPTGLIIDVVRRGPDSPTKVSFSAPLSKPPNRLNLEDKDLPPLEWVSVISNASARICLNVPTRSKQSHFFTEFLAAIRPFAQDLLNCPLVLINGEIRDESEQLFKDLKKKKAESVEVQMFIDTCENKENICEPQVATNLHEVSFDIEIRAAVPSRSKVGAVVAAVKHHLLRNLTARAELQYESMDIVEEGSAAPCSVHQMPRPATTVLHTHPAILLSDYLFEADTIEDAQKNFDELIGLKTSLVCLSSIEKLHTAKGHTRAVCEDEHIDEGWERSLEINEMEAVRAPLDDTPIVNFKSKDDDIGSICTLLIALSVIIAVVGVVVYLAIGR